MSRFLPSKPSPDMEETGLTNFADCAIMSTRPALGEYLTQCKYGDGSRRQTSTLLLFVEDGLLKACLHDRDLQRSLFVSGEDLDALLDRLESSLTSGTAEWRARGGKRGRS